MTTTPITHDYPDWGRQLAQADIIVANHYNEVLAADTVDPVRFVGQYPYIHVRGGANIPNVFIHLDWYMDEAATVFVGANECGAFAATELNTSFPVQAPFVRVTTRLSAYPNTVFLTLTMAPTPAVPYGGFAGDNALIQVLNGGPLGGGANITLNAGAVRGGEAYVEMDVLGAAAFVAYLRVVDRFGFVYYLASNYPAVRARPIRLYLPPLPVQVLLFNQDAGAHDYRVLVSHKSIPTN